LGSENAVGEDVSDGFGRFGLLPLPLPFPLLSRFLPLAGSYIRHRSAKQDLIEADHIQVYAVVE